MFTACLFLVFFCLLPMTSAAKSSENKDCKGEVKDPCREDIRTLLIANITNLSTQKLVYDCDLERAIGAKLDFPEIWGEDIYDDFKNAPRTQYEERIETSNPLKPELFINKAIANWTTELEKMTGETDFGCNFRDDHGENRVACLFYHDW
ncbi:hypothetical protein Y032_0623g780 [Ancylostoma ceylanicum]|nr:hypothetical protein Y032_0623g780 [Ancylostoma ceylanicum]